MQSLAAIELSVTRQSFSAMPGFSTLYRHYCERFDDLAQFYAADYRDRNAIASRAETVAGVSRDRTHLVQTLLAQNEAWGLDEATQSNIEALGDADSVAVVTGQQVGILGGPLYTIYKAATAVALSKELASVTGRPVVPVFWLEGEDHDLDEVKSVTVLSGNEPVTLTYQVPDIVAGGNHGPVGRLKLTDSIIQLIDQLDEILPTTDFKSELMSRIRHAYKPGVSMRTAFARLLKSFFPSDGLVFISPDDRRFKASAVPLFVKEVEESAVVVDAILETSRHLERDYHVQVNVSPTNLFLVDDMGRFAIDAVGQRFQVRGRDLSFSREELVACIQDDPCSISPNVVLRPILQDTLLPTIAYVGGPGEIFYTQVFTD
ncbi:MAG: bacillithiol biosynthesis cysteine-adding enzyme BshC [Rhodothermales bacterium]|nr:bacillithiol biosynthesis cysteine-adding enzyme BshC [Rhodothermales bacterium]